MGSSPINRNEEIVVPIETGNNFITRNEHKLMFAGGQGQIYITEFVYAEIPLFP